MAKTVTRHPKQAVKALVVDDDEDQIIILNSILNQDEAALYELYSAATIESARAILDQQEIDVILLDLNLPDSKGLNTLRSLCDEYFEVPIVVITAIDDKNSRSIGLSSGAEDYLVKGQYDADSIQHAVMNAIERHAQVILMNRKQNELREQLESIIDSGQSPVYSQKDKQLASENERLLRELDHLLHHDTLTELPNRMHFELILRQTLKASRRDQNQFAIMILDIDNFKTTNDAYGHDIGDLLLKQVASRIGDAVRADDLVARLGGDEFGIILRGIESPTAVHKTAQKILSSFSDPFDLVTKKCHITISIGIACYPDGGTSSQHLIMHADIALYHVKDSGRNDFRVFEETIGDEQQQYLEIENALHFAIERGELSMVYQPKVEMITQRIIGMEALIRWNSAEHGMVPPDIFIPIAEKTGLINPIGLWIMETVTAQQKKWIQQNIKLPLAINLSPRQMIQGDLVTMLMEIINKNNIPPELIQFEVTETAIMDESWEWESTLDRLHDAHIHISIDDFGTGFSSLSRLKQLPIQSIKIDLSFIRNVTISHHEMVIVKSIISLAKGLGLTVIAEGVEKEEQAQFLIDNDCDQAQGYYYSKPLPPEKFKHYYEHSTQHQAQTTAENSVRQLCVEGRDIGHNFNNVYAAIKGYTALLQQALPNDDMKRIFDLMKTTMDDATNAIQTLSIALQAFEENNLIGHSVCIADVVARCRVTVVQIEKSITRQKAHLIELKSMLEGDHEPRHLVDKIIELMDKANSFILDYNILLETATQREKG